MERDYRSAIEEEGEENLPDTLVGFLMDNYYDNTMLFYDTEEKKVYGAEELMVK